MTSASGASASLGRVGALAAVVAVPAVVPSTAALSLSVGALAGPRLNAVAWEPAHADAAAAGARPMAPGSHVDQKPRRLAAAARAAIAVVASVAVPASTALLYLAARHTIGGPGVPYVLVSVPSESWWWWLWAATGVQLRGGGRAPFHVTTILWRSAGARKCDT